MKGEKTRGRPGCGRAARYVQVKAAGGVRTLDGLLEVRALGVGRVGATRTADILDECRRRLDLEPIKA